MSIRTFNYRAKPGNPYNFPPAAAPNPMIVSHGKNSIANPKNIQFTSLYAGQPINPDQNAPQLRSRPGTSKNPQGLRPGDQRPSTTAGNQNYSRLQPVYANSEHQIEGPPQISNPMFVGRRNPAKQDPRKDIQIDDNEFYYGEGSDPYKQSLVEQNMYQVLHDHRDCMKAKCLEAKPPVIKKSVYTRDYVPFDRDEPIRGEANSNKPPYKPILPIDVDTTYAVDLFYNRPSINLNREYRTNQKNPQI